MNSGASGPSSAGAGSPALGAAGAAADGDGEARAARAGRGGIAIAGAKAYFIALGLVQQVLLKRVLGLDGYGALSSALSAASMAYNPVVTTSIQGLSRGVAGSLEEDRPATIRRLLGLHLLLAVPFAAAFHLLAPALARWMEAPHLTGSLRALAGILLLYGLYAPLVGVLNGLQRFVGQAGLDVLAATLRTVGLVAGGWWALRAAPAGALRGVAGAEGAAWGFVAAAGTVLVVALVVTPLGRRGEGGVGWGRHLVFVAPLVLGQVLLNLLLQADLTLLRRFAGEAALAAGAGPTAADPLVGAYRATQLFSFLPYQLLLAVTFILFPLLAQAHRDGDREAVARYVRTGVRLALVLMGLMVSVTSGLSGPLLSLVFGADTAELGARSMQVLTLGFGAFALFGIFTTVLNSLGREGESTAVTGGAVALVVALAYFHVRGTAFGPELLWKTALATCLAVALATLVAAFRVHRAAGAVVAPLSLARVVGCLVLVVLAARVLPPLGKVATLGAAASLAAAYLVLLVVTRELGKEDWENLRAVLRRRRGAG